jgi:hypothetical protein
MQFARLWLGMHQSLAIATYSPTGSVEKGFEERTHIET